MLTSTAIFTLIAFSLMSSANLLKKRAEFGVSLKLTMKHPSWKQQSMFVIMMLKKSNIYSMTSRVVPANQETIKLVLLQAIYQSDDQLFTQFWSF
jgi:hypothetical protein